MKTVWNESGQDKAVTAPISLVVTAFADTPDVRKTLTPQLRTDLGDTRLILIDLGSGKQRMGGSALAQVYSQLGNAAPDVDNPQQLKAFFAAIQQLNAENKLLAYHDRSDGGLFATLTEMAFAGRAGLEANLDAASGDAISALFNEELGAVIQVRASDAEAIVADLNTKLGKVAQLIGKVTADPQIRITVNGKLVMDESRIDLHLSLIHI